jgi:hypothetical protein
MEVCSRRRCNKEALQQHPQAFEKTSSHDDAKAAPHIESYV